MYSPFHFDVDENVTLKQKLAGLIAAPSVFGEYLYQLLFKLFRQTGTSMVLFKSLMSIII